MVARLCWKVALEARDDRGSTEHLSFDDGVTKCKVKASVLPPCEAQNIISKT